MLSGWVFHQTILEFKDRKVFRVLLVQLVLGELKEMLVLKVYKVP
jgi:hypothetical protein